jgi:lambda family phage portal protein
MDKLNSPGAGRVVVTDGKGHEIQRGAYGDTQHAAASYDVELRGWSPAPGSADADNNYELYDIIPRARDRHRNDGLARGAVTTPVTAVVGAGLRCIPTPDYRALGKDKKWADEWAATVQSKIESVFNSTDIDASRHDDMGGLTALAMTQMMNNGGVIALPVWIEDGYTPYATSIHMIEIDRLSNPMGYPDTADRRGGIEIDEYGAPQAYWIRKAHPGDQYLYGFSAWNWERIPAFTTWGRRRVIHFYKKERVGQNRGVPFISPVMGEFKVMNDATQSELNAAAANAIITYFVESQTDVEGLKTMFGSYENYLTARSKFQGKLKNKAIMPLFPGDKIQPGFTNRPNQNFGAFFDVIAKNISAGTGVPVEMIRKDFSRMNYSSARAMILEAWRDYQLMRAQLKKGWMQPVYELVFEELVDKGEIPDCSLEDYDRNRYAWTRMRVVGPGMGWVDPVKEAEAAHLRMTTGLSTLESECAEQGKDWREVLDQLKTERSYCAELGIPHPADVKAPKPSSLPEQDADGDGPNKENSNV